MVNDQGFSMPVSIPAKDLAIGRERLVACLDAGLRTSMILVWQWNGSGRGGR